MSSVIEIFQTESFLHLVDPGFGHCDRFSVFVENVIHIGKKMRHCPLYLLAELNPIDNVSRNHKRDSRLVQKNRIRLVDDRKMERTSDQVFFIKREKFPEIVKSRFFSGQVRNIRGVSRTARRRIRSLVNRCDGKT